MIQNFFIKLIYGYQRFISPMLGPRCRYHPTCSNYMVDAIKIHGVIKGLLMGTARILRCNQLFKGGIDYVPQKFSLRRNPDETYFRYKK